jgi:hypothetical protein
MNWIPTKNFADIRTHRAYLVSVWNKEEGKIWSMSAYMNGAGDWLDGRGEKVDGEIYAVAEMPWPAPLTDFRLENHAVIEKAAAEKEPTQ